MAVVAAFVLSGCILSQTGAPRIVADASAQLTGTVRSSQPDAATYWFEYGTTPTYGASTATTSAFLQQGANTVSVWVDTLTAGTTYHYRLCSDVADTLPPNCGSDQVLTTTTGHDAVHGEATSAYQQFCPVAPSFICTYSDSVSIAAAGDPTAGTVEGEVGLNGVVPGTLMSGPLGYSGTGTIRCLRVSGNIAVVGYSYVINSDVAPPVSGDQGLVIEDNGTTGDRYLATTPWSPITACPAPSASLFDAGTPHPGNFVVHG